MGGLSALARPVRRMAPPTSFLFVVAAAAWVGVVVVARDMGSMPGTMGLGIGAFAAVWALMMAAMMLPSVAPFASLYARTFGSHRTRRVSALVSGYLLVWILAALPAYGLAWVAGSLVSGHRTGATVLAVALFAACGVYQLTPIKDRCLARCRSPLGFVLKFGVYRGRTRDVRVGLHHGAFCVACCWSLMALLVAFGLMNVIAMVGLAGAVLVEKTSPWGRWVCRGLGVAALVLAVAVVFEPGLAPGLLPVTQPDPMGGM